MDGRAPTPSPRRRRCPDPHRRILNTGLGYYLIRTGRRANSLILEADGKHVLTDGWTSLGVVAGLALVMLTHWKPFDPLIAIAVAVNILWSGSRLVWRSAAGLLDYSDPNTGNQIRALLDAICSGSPSNTTACVSAPPAIASSSNCISCSPAARRSSEAHAPRYHC